MGSEFGQYQEWNFDTALDWHLTKDPRHGGLKQLVADLNKLYREQPSLHLNDFESIGFNWIDCDDTENSLLSYFRSGGTQTSVVLLNFTPVPRQQYRLGVPEPGSYQLVLNSDAEFYSGSAFPVTGQYHSEAVPWMNQQHSIVLDLPPLAGIILIRS